MSDISAKVKWLDEHLNTDKKMTKLAMEQIDLSCGEGQIYQSISGLKCFTSSKNTIKYPKAILNIFNDPISFEYMQKPVVITNVPYHVYDRDFLVK